VTRRRLLGGIAASFSTNLFAAFHRPLGVQIYTVRTLLPAKGDATLRAIAAIGYKEVEIELADARKFAAVLKETGLRPTSSHISGGLAKLDESIAQAKELGIPAIGIPYVMPRERANPTAFWPAFADQLNDAGERCRKAGLTFFYHHHNFEFEPGSRGIDILHDKLTRDVKLEIDCFWASVGGADPAGLIKKWTGRIFALHLKDRGAGTAVSYDTDKVKPAEFREVGAGVIDWPGVLKSGVKAGARHFFVEQDYTPGDPLESLKKSYAFLRGV
jgi:sugar phosphate isomerase/epimerase